MRIHRRVDADPREGVKKYGATSYADPVNKKYPIDTLGRIKAAWAYIHQPRNAEKYTSYPLFLALPFFQNGRLTTSAGMDARYWCGLAVESAGHE